MNRKAGEETKGLAAKSRQSTVKSFARVTNVAWASSVIQAKEQRQQRQLSAMVHATYNEYQASPDKAKVDKVETAPRSIASIFGIDARFFLLHSLHYVPDQALTAS